MTDSNFKLLAGMGIRTLMHIIGRRHICTNTPVSWALQNTVNALSWYAREDYILKDPDAKIRIGLR
jgi:hypothetical protein